MGTSPNCLAKQYQASAGDKFGWQNGLNSRCMPVTWLFNTYAYQFPDSTYKEGWRDSMCYKSSCTSEGALQLDILGNKVNCPTGQTVDLSKVGDGQQHSVAHTSPCGVHMRAHVCSVEGWVRAAWRSDEAYIQDVPWRIK